MKKSNAWILWGGLFLTLILTWRMSTHDASEQTVLPIRILAQTNIPLQMRDIQPFQQSIGENEKLTLRKSYESISDLFALAEVKEEPAETNRKKSQVQPIIVPPLPFKYIGRWKDQTQTLVLLSMNDEIISAKVGDTIFNKYQLQNVTENAQVLTLQFLNQPFHQTQILQVGKAQDE